MAASSRREWQLLRLLTLYTLLFVVIIGIHSVASDDSDDISDSEDAILNPSLPTSPPVAPMLTTTSALATQVVVHVAERFLPFASRTIVGLITSPNKTDEEDEDKNDDRDTYRVMFSFSAYAFTNANAEAMDCFLISDNGSTWQKAVPDSYSTVYSQGFCARRDIASDSSSYGVAVFRKRADGPTLVHAARDSTIAVVAKAGLRGWTESPIATFRVTRLERWRAAPTLDLVANVSAITVPENATDQVTAASLCPPDPLGRVVRLIEGGNYYGAGIALPFTVLCVSYVQRSLHDLNSADKFFSHVKLLPVSGWTFNVCQWHWKEVMDLATQKMVLVKAANKDMTLICYQDTVLQDDEDDPTDLEDTDDLLKSIYINETDPDIDNRVVIEYHAEDAWTFTPSHDDLTAINSF